MKKKIKYLIRLNKDFGQYVYVEEYDAYTFLYSSRFKDNEHIKFKGDYEYEIIEKETHLMVCGGHTKHEVNEKYINRCYEKLLHMVHNRRDKIEEMKKGLKDIKILNSKGEI